jgi:regulator of replication initiation timing
MSLNESQVKELLGDLLISNRELQIENVALKTVVAQTMQQMQEEAKEKENGGDKPAT